ncbi:flagellar assembly protein T N-terminal domain-containing protein [Marinobacterium rhizophilum]|uniref:Flagellar assembly protein T N-terminal domain-containing protein n=1 Tax=Marinobacterium rhizophilum TaxID=420402 RepID=A0ABY5HG72_9GAMM|nr:flagellar assembly protein T N-terminal domain-containing protein [Marinobacterium rhizophilum]UTW10307.1 flagellar assembly protein T N-terminal domain-containing protein [Marinobacterium rhizophilum]
MFSLLLRITGLALLVSLGTLAQAETLQAEGRALITGTDLASARRAAIQDATEQAALQAAAYISVNQRMNDGILEVDNLHMASLGQVRNVQLLEERRQGNWLLVRISADVDIAQGCSNGSHHQYRNRLAVTAFVLQRPQDASLGQLDNIEQALALELAAKLNLHPRLDALNAGHTRLIDNPLTAPTRQLDDGRLQTLQPHAGQLGPQYLVSGVVRDLSMQNPAVHQEQNVVKHWINRAQHQDERYLRHFAVDLFVHDALSGALLFSHQYQTQGLWNLPMEQDTGFATAAFWQQDYGRKTRELLERAGRELSEELACLPFRAPITRVENSRIWFDAGSSTGIARGDRLSLLRLDRLRDNSLDNSSQTLVVDDVQALSASGTLGNSSEVFNIQRGDFVSSQ